MADGFDLGSAYGRIIIDGSGIDGDIQSAKSGLTAGLDSLSSGLTNVGAALTGLGAPIAAAFGAGVMASLDFSQAVTNTGAVLGLTRDEITALHDDLLAIGGDTTAGPQLVAEAYYDIAGGVADASSHMAILNSAIATSEAGNASLTGTTSALIAVMNSYKFSADQASFASDVLTRTVGMGVGSMDEFATALPQVTGLANSLSIGFDDLGAMTAYLTTQGNSAAQSTTQLAAMMTALLNPNERMKDALAELGFTSGTAAIEQLGLVGAMEALAGTSTATEQGMAGMLGSVEALRGVTALTGGEFATFAETFKNGITDATAAAQAIQMGDPAQQFALLQSTVSELAITAGDALVPALVTIMGTVRPLIDSVISWVRENPQLTAQIGLLAGALTIAGPLLIGVGAAIGAISTIIGAIVSPIGLAIAGVAALAAAYATNFGGIRDFVETQVAPVIQGFFDGLAGAWTSIQPGLSALATWFTTEGLPAVVTFVNENVVPAVQGFIDILSGAWAVIGPALGELVNWFTVEGLPGVVTFIAETAQVVVGGFFDLLAGAWAIIQPLLQPLLDWFSGEDGLGGAVTNLSTNIQPIIQGFIDMLSNVWTVVGPILGALANWFTTTGLPQAIDFINTTALAGLQALIDLLTGLWTAVEPGLTAFRDGIQAVFSFIQVNVIDPIKAAIDSVANALGALGGGAGSTATTAAQNAANSILGRASGGPVGADRLYMVGEQGPELFMPDSNGTIIPNHALGGTTYNVTITPQINPAAGPVGEQADLFSELFMQQIRSRA